MAFDDRWGGVCRRPRAIVVGAGHVGLHTSRIAVAVGFDVTVVDDREGFADPERFPEAERVTVGKLGEALAGISIDGDSYVVVVTRGHGEDGATLRQVVSSGAAYVGMIGSRTRVRTVKERPIQDGFPRETVDRVHAPIGLDIGAETPEVIVLSIVAEMVKVRRRHSAGRRRGRGPSEVPSALGALS
ncbi:MAG: XdhC family protein [Sphingomonadaceae bacterium]